MISCTERERAGSACTTPGRSRRINNSENQFIFVSSNEIVQIF
ncbi:MAG: hypothetical protein ABTQ26_19525 [Azonexus sp.]